LLVRAVSGRQTVMQQNSIKALDKNKNPVK